MTLKEICKSDNNIKCNEYEAGWFNTKKPYHFTFKFWKNNHEYDNGLILVQVIKSGDDFQTLLYLIYYALYQVGIRKPDSHKIRYIIDDHKSISYNTEDKELRMYIGSYALSTKMIATVDMKTDDIMLYKFNHDSGICEKTGIRCRPGNYRLIIKSTETINMHDAIYFVESVKWEILEFYKYFTKTLTHFTY